MTKYDVFQNCKIHRSVTKEEANKIIMSSWSPYMVYIAGTNQTAREFIPL